MTPAALVDAARTSFERARRRVGARAVDGLLGGRHVRLSIAGDFFATQLPRALALGQLEPARGTNSGAAGSAALTLHAWDAASTGVRLAGFSWAGLNLGPGGVVEELSDERYHVSLELHGALASVLDRATGMAFHYVPDPALMPPWETTHPARMLLSAWARAAGLLTCHAAAVAADGQGVLLAGSSGAGKSTTALACLAAGMQAAGDDYVLVEPGAAPIVHALYRSTLLEVEHYRRNTALMPAVDHIADHVDRSKAVMFAGDRLTGGFLLVGLVALRVEAGSTPRFAPASAGKVLRALAPSTLAQLGMVDAAGLHRLAELCRRLPCFELVLGDDPSGVPVLVGAMIEQAALAAPAAQAALAAEVGA